MATFTGLKDDRIAFRTIGDERASGLLLLLHGSAFAAMPAYWMPIILARGEPIPILFLSATLLIGLAEVGVALWLLFRSNWLVLDLRSRTYRGRRGLLSWGESFAGPIDDFDSIGLASRRVQRRSKNQEQWFVEWAWRGGTRRPFRVDHWGRMQSFQLTPRHYESDPVDGLAFLHEIAVRAGLPLEIPARFFDGPGAGCLNRFRERIATKVETTINLT
ncbi:MAG TPA: hypothetical protein VG406_27180 [Isosphaeraceae bacterium]|jgi:hypothetical protein|nr:hypothetical protein [Isosphaeraceae bacterium]